MNENTEEEVVTSPNAEASPVVAEEGGEEAVVDTTAADQLATTPDNNAPQNAEVPKCGISGVELKEGDEVVAQVVPGTENSEGYLRIVLVSALSAEEVAALPEGSIKTFPKLN